MSTSLPARVVRLDARGCLVRLDEPLDDLPDGHTLWCSVRGRIHRSDRTHQKSPVVVPIPDPFKKGEPADARESPS